jgi:hypothetical protein
LIARMMVGMVCMGTTTDGQTEGLETPTC